MEMHLFIPIHASSYSEKEQLTEFKLKNYPLKVIGKMKRRNRDG